MIELFVSLAFATDTNHLTKLVQTKLPAATVVASKDCDLGLKKKKVTAVVSQTKGDHPLQALIIDGQRVTVLNLASESSNGSASDFLSDFYDSETKAAKPIDIRCAVPGVDKDITPIANGEFKKGFKNTGKHVCFQASDAYNNWSCFNSDKSGKIRPSFVQMNAD